MVGVRDEVEWKSGTKKKTHKKHVGEISIR